MLENRTTRAARADHWLTPARLRLYSALTLAILVVVEFGTTQNSLRRYGLPVNVDYTTFWAASRVWLDGMPLAAYSHDAILRVIHQIAPATPPQHPGPFFYPPNYLLLLRPLALLPFGVSLALFVPATFCALFPLARKVLPMRAAILPILAFPGIWLNMLDGQNGMLTAALAFGAFLLLKKRPVWAGICIGLLSIKPQLAILFPLALACAGMWTAFAAAAVTVVLFTGLALLVFGLGAIPAFLHSMVSANSMMSAGALPWAASASLFSALRLLNVPEHIAYVAQACQALAAAGAVAWVWRRTGNTAVRATALVAGACMMSPYIFNYDTVWLGIGIALFTAKALRDGWLRWERELLVVAWVYPAFGNFSSEALHTNIGPLVFASILFMAARRAYVETRPQPDAPVAVQNRTLTQ